MKKDYQTVQAIFIHLENQDVITLSSALEFDPVEEEESKEE